MTRIVRGVEFSDRASDSRYPFIPPASVTDSTGVFQIPNDFLVAAYLSIPADLQIEPGYVFVSRIVNSLSSVTLYVSARIAGEMVEIGQFDVSVASVGAQIQRNLYGVVLFKGAVGYEDLRGRVSVRSLENLALQPQGEFEFDFDAAGLEPDCIRPHLRHVAALEVEQPGGVVRLGGTVRLAPGSNCRLRVEVVAGEQVVYFDALDASQLNEDLECEDGVSPPIRRINGISGDSQRAVELLGSRCLEIQSLSSEIQLRNRCSEPCASCEEAEQVRSLVAPFATQIPSLIGLANRVEQAVIQTQLNVASSRGGQSACQSEE
jgi:hypothetical protein